MEQELIDLLNELESAKALEKVAKDNRINVENKILALMPNDKLEGSLTNSNDELSVTVSNGVTRTCDFGILLELEKELPDNLKLVDLKPSLNLKNLRTIEQTAGERFLSGLSKAITIKPKKPSVSFKRK